MAIANRLPGTFAFAAAVAACLLCGAAATFSRGDLLMIAGSHIPLGGSTTNATYLVVCSKTDRLFQPGTAIVSGRRHKLLTLG